MADDGNEFEEIAETLLNDFPHDGEIDDFVSVDQDVPETDHAPEPGCKISGNPTRALEQVGELAIGSRFSQPFIGHDVGCNVEHALDRNLQRVLDESLLTDVGGDVRRPAQRPELLDARFDLSQLLRDEIGVGHVRPVDPAVRRYPVPDRRKIEKFIARSNFKADSPRAIPIDQEAAVAKDAMHEIGRCVVENDDLHRTSKDSLQVGLEGQGQRVKRRLGPVRVKNSQIDIARGRGRATCFAAVDVDGERIGCVRFEIIAKLLFECRRHREIIRPATRYV